MIHPLHLLQNSISIASFSFLFLFIPRIRSVLPSSVTDLESFRLVRVKPNYHVVQQLKYIEAWAVFQDGRQKQTAALSSNALKSAAVVLRLNRHLPSCR
jgi:hypothetical protein